MYIVRMEGLHCKDYIGRITLYGLRGWSRSVIWEEKVDEGHVAPSVQQREVAARAVIN